MPRPKKCRRICALPRCSSFGPLEGAADGRVEMAVEEYEANYRRLVQDVKENTKAKLLLLDSTKAREQLGWRCVWDTPAAIRRTAEWYRDFYQLNAVNTTGDLDAYCECAEKEGLAWTK